MNKNGDYDVYICNIIFIGYDKKLYIFYFFDCCFKILYM